MAGAPLGPDGRVANKALLPEEIRRLLRQGRPSIGFFEGRGDAKDQLVWDALHGFAGHNPKHHSRSDLAFWSIVFFAKISLAKVNLFHRRE